MFQQLVAIQRDIYLALAEQIKLLSAEGNWLGFLGFLPMGIFFGAVHALRRATARRCWRPISRDRRRRSRAAC